jgi:hypothetical protein
MDLVRRAALVHGLGRVAMMEHAVAAWGELPISLRVGCSYLPSTAQAKEAHAMVGNVTIHDFRRHTKG